MSATTIADQRRELAHRVGGGLEIKLYWNAADDSTSVEVKRIVSGTTMRFAVPADQALDAFYHPLAHVGYSTAP